MRKLYVANTRIGPFYIAESEGRFHVIYGDNSLGSYSRPEQAIGTDTANLGIPEDLNEWQRVEPDV